jgi:SpoVK/Ycf46/Vps4 family AAA+-type ATPase
MASQYKLNLREIGQAMALARGQSSEGLADRAWKFARQATLPRLNMLAQRIEARATWDDLVLGDEALQSLRQIAAQVRQRYRVYEDWGYARKMNRGLGISALFSGESGTGKTMAAEVIANELDLALYRIDLSAVVSKYIGETEKNLRRLFDAAETGGAILFFDEADALFGKRSEVKDSHDRYANIEINYLLQRMESFSGLAILATNMRSALDTAFLRRLRFVVDFKYPGAAERKRLWQQVILQDVPKDGLDFDRLARFNLSGGNVASVALNAAFAAAQRDTPLTMPLLLSSLRTELRKLDKPANESEFR